MMNYIRPSMRNLDAVFEELRIPNWSSTMTLNISNMCWNAVVDVVTVTPLHSIPILAVTTTFRR